MSVRITYSNHGKVEADFSLTYGTVEELPQVLKEGEERINQTLSDAIKQSLAEDA
jgi:hypothetical protein